MSKFQKQMTGEGLAVVFGLVMVGLYFFGVYLMVDAMNDGDWPQAIFWLVGLVGWAIERKLDKIIQK